MSEARKLINQMLRTKCDFEKEHDAPPRQIDITADEFENLRRFATVHVNYKGDLLNTFSGVRIVVKKAI